MAEAVAPEDQEKGTPPNQKRADSNVTQSSDNDNDLYDASEDQPLISKDGSDKSPVRHCVFFSHSFSVCLKWNPL